MNRAWIPAGALASVSVAGLIALGPLTDSLGTTVEFPGTVSTPSTVKAPTRTSVPVSVSLKPVGSTKTAALTVRGGAASAPPTNNDQGFVGTKNYVTPKAPVSSTPDTPTAPAIEPKKLPKRQEVIGETGETNGSEGLAGGSNGSQGQGEQASTPGNDVP